VRSGRHRRGARRGVKSIGRSPRAAQILPPSQRVQFALVLTSSALAARSASASVRPDRVWDGRPRLGRPPSRDLPSGGSGPDAASLGRASTPSSPSAPHMRCPGSVLQRSRRLSASKPLHPPRRSRGTTASSASGRRWRSCLRRHGNRAGVPSAETRPSLPLQRHPRGGIVSARRGELMRSFRGVQVQTLQWAPGLEPGTCGLRVWSEGAGQRAGRPAETSRAPARALLP